MCFQDGRTRAAASKRSSQKQGATVAPAVLGSSSCSRHSSDRHSLWKRFGRDDCVLPANRATLACLASYGQRAIPLISSPAASRLSICRNKEKGQRSEVKPTLTFSVWDFHTLHGIIFKALPLWGLPRPATHASRSFHLLFLSWRIWRRSVRSRALTCDVSGTLFTFLRKYTDQECHGIPAPQRDGRKSKTGISLINKLVTASIWAITAQSLQDQIAVKYSVHFDL